jgi:integrase-like protein
MHRTLKTKATKPAAANVLQQQARFDTFVARYNQERPHQALGMKVPAELYTRSAFWLVTFMRYDLGYFDDEMCRPRTHRESVQPETVTYVLGMNCYPCVQKGPKRIGSSGWIRTATLRLTASVKSCRVAAHTPRTLLAPTHNGQPAHISNLRQNPCGRIDGVQKPLASLTNTNARTWLTHEVWQRHCPSKARRMPAHIFRHRRGQFWCRDQSFSFTLVVYQMSRIPCAPPSVRVEKK